MFVMGYGDIGGAEVRRLLMAVTAVPCPAPALRNQIAEAGIQFWYEFVLSGILRKSL